ncbi:MAG: DUF4345 domain-containing protein [Pseudomonadales bacterium]|nr:DUF4345 domain-containing protein [Pseudomonadales bacterium]
MESTLKYILYTIFVVSLITGLNILIGGALAVPGATIAVQAQIDNELRFFSMFWLAYGGFCFWTGRNLRKRNHFIPLIALVFFLGGVGRLFSTLMVGSPGSFLLGAMIVEFVLPLVMYVIYKKQKNNEFVTVTN